MQVYVVTLQENDLEFVFDVYKSSDAKCFIDRDVVLDKYLQKAGEQPLRAASANSHSPTTISLHFHHGAASTTSRPPSSRPLSATSNPARLSREVIAGPLNVAKGQPVASKTSSHPPLASAYFPNKANVT